MISKRCNLHCDDVDDVNDCDGLNDFSDVIDVHMRESYLVSTLITI